jgi:AbrB family looped-hinge helix DNA binding protein
MSQSDKRRFYGAITVSERGQIVIPAEARRDFGIEVGDKLLVFGDLDKGLALAKASMLMSYAPNVEELLNLAREDEDAEDKTE